MGKIINGQKLVVNFNPVISSESEEWRDYLDSFDAGAGNESFTEFLKNREYEEFIEEGDGVTYVIKNINGINGDGTDLIGYFTLAVNAIPYISRIRDDRNPENVDEETCGIPVLEIKLFAVNESYQDHYCLIDGAEFPIAAVCLLFIIGYANELIEKTAGFKALFLHSVPQAENFYIRNGFKKIEHFMKPLHGIDSDYTPLWMPLRPVTMSYDE